MSVPAPGGVGYLRADRLARALAWPLSRLVAVAESVETEDRKPLGQPLRDPRQRS